MEHRNLKDNALSEQQAREQGGGGAPLTMADAFCAPAITHLEAATGRYTLWVISTQNEAFWKQKAFKE